MLSLFFTMFFIHQRSRKIINADVINPDNIVKRDTIITNALSLILKGLLFLL